jgi:hypothetical protein
MRVYPDYQEVLPGSFPVVTEAALFRSVAKPEVYRSVSRTAGEKVWI